MNLYILNEKGNPVEEPDRLKWAKWFETANRRVAHEKIGNAEISTVFLGVNHSFGCGKPVLWETMVFGGKFDQEQYRCSGSRYDAEKMHARMVKKVQHDKE